MEEELAEYDKEINVLNDLQKQYTHELNEFAVCRQELESRKTKCGKLGQIVGKITAVLFINKFYNGCYNVIYPPQ
jgi:hypothetical protein